MVFEDSSLFGTFRASKRIFQKLVEDVRTCQAVGWQAASAKGNSLNRQTSINAHDHYQQGHVNLSEII